MKSAEDVLQFWFVEHGNDDWFGGGPEFDEKLSAQFGETGWRWKRTCRLLVTPSA